MSVIGRLDGQVDKILIAPLAKRDAPEQPGDSHNAQPSENAAPIEETAQAARKGQAPANEKTRRRDLPVWLL